MTPPAFAEAYAEVVAKREEATRVVFAAWDAFRRSQQVPWPGGEALRAQSRLFHLTEPYASGREPVDGADLGAIQAAAADLSAVIGGEGRAAA